MGPDHPGELIFHHIDRFSYLLPPGTTDSVGPFKDCHHSHCSYRNKDEEMSYTSFYRIRLGCEGEAIFTPAHINHLLVEAPTNGKS